MQARLGSLSDTDIRLLKVFITVNDCGGLTAAEFGLNIGRSTISRHLKDLEIRLGMVLCRRGRAGFSLTNEGRQVYDYAKSLLTSIDAFRNQINDIHKNLQGKIVIAMFDKTVSNRDCRVSDAIARYLTKAPEVEVEIQVVPVNQVEQGILDGRYHVGIAPSHRKTNSLSYIPLFEEKMSLYCGRSNPLFSKAASVNAEKIRQQNFAGLSFNSPNMDYCAENGLHRTAIANDQEGIVTLILSGKYIGFVPEHYAKEFVKAGLLRKLDNSNLSYFCEFAAICKKSPKPTRLTQLFLQALNEEHHFDAAIPA